MIRILSNYRCRAGCSTSSHGRLPPPYEGLETALVRRQRWPGAVVQKHRDVITVTRVKRQKCIKHADFFAWKNLYCTQIVFFFFRWTVPRHSEWCCGSWWPKNHGKSWDFSQDSSPRSPREDSRSAGHGHAASLSRWALDLLLFNPGKTWSISKRSHSIIAAIQFMIHNT